MKFSTSFWAAFSVFMALLTAPAQSAVPEEISDLAVELAYTSCLDLMAGDIEIGGQELEALGFNEPPKQLENPSVGPMEMIEIGIEGGSIAISNSSGGGFCQVLISGSKSQEAHDALRSNLHNLDYDSQRDEANSYENALEHEGNTGNMSVETLSADLDEEFSLVVQFIRLVGPLAQTSTFQIMVME